MSARALLAAALTTALAACGGDSGREVRLLAPAWFDADFQRFERGTGCRVDLRVYDAGEELDPIAERRDVDVVAAPGAPGAGDETQEFVQITLSGGVQVTIPKRLAAAFRGPQKPAAQRSVVWRIRPEGDNDDCARRWLAYVTSQ